MVAKLTKENAAKAVAIRVACRLADNGYDYINVNIDDTVTLSGNFHPETLRKIADIMDGKQHELPRTD